MAYAEFPTRFVWLNQQKMWQPRKKGYAIRRLSYIPASVGELYYMRILLMIQRGCVDYDSIKLSMEKSMPVFKMHVMLWGY